MSDRAVIGIDPASNRFSIVAIFANGSKMRAKTFKVADKMAPATCGLLYHAVAEFLSALPINAREGISYIESPLVGRGGVKTTMVQAFASGAIQAALVHCGFSVYLVNVSSWKREVCGNGNATKDEVARAVFNILPAPAVSLLAGDGDLIDAAAIAVYGTRVSKRAQAIGEGMAK